LECGEDRRFGIFPFRRARWRNKNGKAAMVAALQSTTPTFILVILVIRGGLSSFW
jgi:hypothetical protein